MEPGPGRRDRMKNTGRRRVRMRRNKRRTISVSPAATDTAQVFTAVPCCLSQCEQVEG